MSDQVETLGEALPREMARVRDEVLPHYLELWAPGFLAVRIIRESLAVAAKALSDGDVVAMIRAYEDLKAYEA